MMKRRARGMKGGREDRLGAVLARLGAILGHLGSSRASMGHLGPVWAVWIRWVWAHLVWFKLMFPKSVGLERAEVSEGMVFIRTSCWFYSGAVFPEWAYEGAGG